MIAVRKHASRVRPRHADFLYPRNRASSPSARVRGRDASCASPTSRAPPQAVELDLGRFRGRVPIELTGGSAFPPIGELPYLLTLPAYGYFWFVLADQDALPRWHAPAPEPLPELITLVMATAGRACSASANAPSRARACCRAICRASAGSAPRTAASRACRVSARSRRSSGAASTTCCSMVDGRRRRRRAQRYFLPLSRCGGEEQRGPARQAAVRARQGAARRRMGALFDAAHDEAFVATHDRAPCAPARTVAARGRRAPLRRRGPRSAQPADDAAVQLARRRAEQCLDRRRRRRAAQVLSPASRPGMHPEIEMGAFSPRTRASRTRRASWARVELRRPTSGEPHGARRRLRASSRNQGDAWHVVTEALDRVARGVIGAQPRRERGGRKLALPARYRRRSSAAHRRAAHRACAHRRAIPPSRPSRSTPTTSRRWVDGDAREAESAFDALARRRKALPADVGRARRGAAAPERRRV